MYWPTRRLVAFFAVPAVASLALFIPGTGMLKPVLLGIDLAIAIVAIGDAATLRGSRKLVAHRSVPPIASQGVAFEIGMKIANPTPREWSVRLRDERPPTFQSEPAEFQDRLRRRSVAEFSSRVVPRQRGTFPLERVDLWVRSGLGLWRRSLWLPCGSMVRVYPDVRQIARYALLARRDRLSAIGLRRSRRLGSDNEFERMRDYIEGDEPRHIDWRATARRRKLTVRAHQTNQSQRIIFLIDSGRMMTGDAGDGRTPLDCAINAMILLSHIALIRGDQVGLIVYADGIRAFAPPAGGAKRITRLVHEVHNLFPQLVESRHDRAFEELHKRCQKRSLVVLITNVFDDVGATSIRSHIANLAGRHLPLAVLLRDRDLFHLADEAKAGDGSLFAGAAAASMLNWRERVIGGLKRDGSLVLDQLPEHLTASLVNRYLDIKARHLL